MQHNVCSDNDNVPLSLRLKGYHYIVKINIKPGNWFKTHSTAYLWMSFARASLIYNIPK